MEMEGSLKGEIPANFSWTENLQVMPGYWTILDNAEDQVKTCFICSFEIVLHKLLNLAVIL